MATFKQRLKTNDPKKIKALGADVAGAIEHYEEKIAENVEAANEAREERLSLSKIQTVTEHDRIAAEDARDSMYKLGIDLTNQEAAARDGVRLLEERRESFNAQKKTENSKLEIKRQALDKKTRESKAIKIKSEAELTKLLKEADDNNKVAEALKNKYQSKISKLETMAKELL